MAQCCGLRIEGKVIERPTEQELQVFSKVSYSANCRKIKILLEKKMNLVSCCVRTFLFIGKGRCV